MHDMSLSGTPVKYVLDKWRRRNSWRAPDEFWQKQWSLTVVFRPFGVRCAMATPCAPAISRNFRQRWT
jgi:hypothetical protein